MSFSSLVQHHNDLEIKSPCVDIKDEDGNVKVITLYEALQKGRSGSFKLIRLLDGDEAVRESRRGCDIDQSIIDSSTVRLLTFDDLAESNFIDLSVSIFATCSDRVTVKHNLVVGKEYNFMQLSVAKDNTITFLFGDDNRLTVSPASMTKCCVFGVNVKVDSMYLKITASNYSS